MHTARGRRGTGIPFSAPRGTGFLRTLNRRLTSRDHDMCGQEHASKTIISMGRTSALGIPVRAIGKAASPMTGRSTSPTRSSSWPTSSRAACGPRTPSALAVRTRRRTSWGASRSPGAEQAGFAASWRAMLRQCRPHSRNGRERPQTSRGDSGPPCGRFRGRALGHEVARQRGRSTSSSRVAEPHNKASRPPRLGEQAGFFQGVAALAESP
jgi:hypothetical protein